MRTKNMKPEDLIEFNKWFEGQELNMFTADQKSSIYWNALNNTVDVPVDDKLDCAKQTVLMYIDQGVVSF